MQAKNRMLIIIPKVDRTIIGIYLEDKCIYKINLPCQTTNHQIEDEVKKRQGQILQQLNEAGINVSKLNAVTAVGGLLRPVEGGTYEVNTLMKRDLYNNYNGKHVSNLGGIIAERIASDLNIPAYIIDPPVVDEMEQIARYSGMPNIERKSVFHALNQKAVARQAAQKLEMTYEEANFLIAHIGNGISVAAHHHGKVIDVNNGLYGDGPFSLERAGSLPSMELIEFFYKEAWKKDHLLQHITFHNGLKGYLGVGNIIELKQMLHRNDPFAVEITEAMGYQIAKEIGAMSTVLAGQIDAIVLTGELAHIGMLTDYIIQRISWIGDVMIYPGEAELQALNAGTLRVLRNEELPKIYQQ